MSRMVVFLYVKAFVFNLRVFDCSIYRTVKIDFIVSFSSVFLDYHGFKPKVARVST